MNEYRKSNAIILTLLASQTSQTLQSPQRYLWFDTKSEPLAVITIGTNERLTSAFVGNDNESHLYFRVGESYEPCAKFKQLAKNLGCSGNVRCIEYITRHFRILFSITGKCIVYPNALPDGISIDFDTSAHNLLDAIQLGLVVTQTTT
jgi:hypothetical protein